MYKLIYFDSFLKDIYNISFYIKNNLNNYTASDKLFKDIMDKINLLENFPYIMNVRRSEKIHIYEYRNIRIRKYLVFYVIDEKNKLIVIARVIYKKRIIDKLLK